MATSDINTPDLRSTFPSLPAGELVYAIGDIHGRLDLLTQLIGSIEQDAKQHPGARTTIIFLGDYIDRGPFSRNVIDYLLGLRFPDAEIIFLRGNHEEFLLSFLAGDYSTAPAWLRYGGAETLLSYGIRASKAENPDWDGLRREMQEKIPAAHLAFLNSTRLSHTLGDYFFVHAGIKPNVDLDRQSKSDLLYIRREFLDATDRHEKLIVHGHSIAAKPDVQSNRIGIDTGAFATGHLTCLVLFGARQTFLTT